MIGEEVLYLSVRELGERIRSRQFLRWSSPRLISAETKSMAGCSMPLPWFSPTSPCNKPSRRRPRFEQGHYRGPLHGIPYAAKDLLAVKGYPTTWGARPYQRQVFDYDATVIRKLNDAGRNPSRQGGHDRVGGRTGLPLRIGVMDPCCEKSLEHRLLDLRIVERFGRDCGSGTGGVRHWHRDLGLDPVSVGLLWRVGTCGPRLDA